MGARLLALGPRLRLACTYRARPVPELTLVMVALLTVQGIGKVLDPDSNVFEEVAGSSCRSWPRRRALVRPRPNAAS